LQGAENSRNKAVPTSAKDHESRKHFEQRKTGSTGEARGAVPAKAETHFSMQSDCGFPLA
jgi:hypothetical protein